MSACKISLSESQASLARLHCAQEGIAILGVRSDGGDLDEAGRGGAGARDETRRAASLGLKHSVVGGRQEELAGSVGLSRTDIVVGAGRTGAGNRNLSKSKALAQSGHAVFQVR